MEEKDFLEIMDSYTKSSGHKKFQNYIREIFESDYFQNFVSNIRKKYNIPASGFGEENDIIFPPILWTYRNDADKVRKFRGELEKLCKKYKIHLLDGTHIFENYIFYNNEDYALDLSGYSMCLVTDVVEEKEEPFSEKVQEYDDLLYPIAIRVSPYASLRDILDFIKRTYKFPISHLQKKYQDKEVRLGKYKKRKGIIQDRNEFIYKNRNLPRKEIMTLIADKFGSENVIDYGYIGKIISLEKKRRAKL